MRRFFWFVILAMFLCVRTATAQSNIAVLVNDTTIRAALDRTQPLLQVNACADAACQAKYRVEDRANDVFIPVTNVAIDSANRTFTVTLPHAPASLKSLFLTVVNLMVPDPSVAPSLVNPEPSKSAGRKDVQVRPQIRQHEIDPNTLIYQSVLPQQLGNDLAAHVDLSGKIKINDPDDLKRPYSVRVTDVQNETDFIHLLRVRGLPRAKKLEVDVSGIDMYKGTPVAAPTATIRTRALPKSRDEANAWITVSADADDVKDEQKYKLDTRLHYDWNVGGWKIGPTLDLVVGNTTSKAPNTGSISTDFRYVFGSSSGAFADDPGVLFEQAFVISPIFRSDRKFENRDFGLDIVWQPRFTAFEHSLEFRRRQAVMENRDPFALAWGFTIKPTLAIEFGRHIASSSPLVENEEFVRGRGGLNVVLERERVRLTVDGVWRHLANDEVVISGDNVVTIMANERRHLRADLQYDLGVVALTLTHMNGRLPPAYTGVHTTSFGLTLKF